MAPNARWQFVLLYTAPADAMANAVAGISDAVLDGAVSVGGLSDLANADHLAG